MNYKGYLLYLDQSGDPGPPTQTKFLVTGGFAIKIDMLPDIVKKIFNIYEQYFGKIPVNIRPEEFKFKTLVNIIRLKSKYGARARIPRIYVNVNVENLVEDIFSLILNIDGKCIFSFAVNKSECLKNVNEDFFNNFCEDLKDDNPALLRRIKVPPYNILRDKSALEKWERESSYRGNPEAVAPTLPMIMQICCFKGIISDFEDFLHDKGIGIVISDTLGGGTRLDSFLRLAIMSIQIQNKDRHVIDPPYFTSPYSSPPLWIADFFAGSIFRKLEKGITDYYRKFEDKIYSEKIITSFGRLKDSG